MAKMGCIHMQDMDGKKAQILVSKENEEDREAEKDCFL